MATLADVLRQTGYSQDGTLVAPATDSPMTKALSEHIKTLPQQLATNQAALDSAIGSWNKTDFATGLPNPNYRPEAIQEVTAIMPVAGTITKALPRKDLIANQLEAISNDIYAGLREANKSTYPKIPVGNIFKNPQGKLPEGKIKSFDDVIEKQLELPTKEIDISAIVPTQRSINFDNLQTVKNVKDAKDAILAVENQGKYYLIDGHHRVANDILKNKDKINVRVYEEK